MLFLLQIKNKKLFKALRIFISLKILKILLCYCVVMLNSTGQSKGQQLKVPSANYIERNGSVGYVVEFTLSSFETHFVRCKRSCVITDVSVEFWILRLDNS